MGDSGRWDKFGLDLQNVAYRHARGVGLALFRVAYVVRDGELSQWSEPRICQFRPGGSNDVMDSLVGPRGDGIDHWQEFLTIVRNNVLAVKAPVAVGVVNYATRGGILEAWGEPTACAGDERDVAAMIDRLAASVWTA